MAQRFVIWDLPNELNPLKRKNNPASLELTPEVLTRTSPRLAAMLDGGRITSHSFAVSQGNSFIVTFVVEFDEPHPPVPANPSST